MKLSAVQQEAVDFHKGCCNVIASAGSGKTRVLVNRIANLIEKYDVDPNKILAITFSKKAKENMSERLEQIIPDYNQYVNVETFHSFGYRIVRKFTRLRFELIDSDWKKVKIVEEILNDRFGEKDTNGSEIGELIKFISIQKNHLIPPEGDDRQNTVYKFYESYKEQHRLLDFDDMLTKCYELLSQSPKSLEYCQEQYQYILADEMQDTNTAQYEIIKLIGQKYKNVFIVDDPLQNIFMWRGSDNKYVLEFDQDWDNVKTINLNKNYRSSKNVVSMANSFAKNIPESNHKHYVESVADKAEFMPPLFCQYTTEFEESIGVANEINVLIENGYSYKDFAILARTNAQLQIFETALFNNEIPYVIVDGLSFVDRKEIKIILSYLRLAIDFDDDKAFEYIYNKPNRWLGKQFLDEVKREARKEKTSLYRAMFTIGRRNWKYKKGIDEICNLVNTLGSDHFKTVSDRIKYLRNAVNLDAFVSKDLCENDDNKTDNMNSLENMAKNYNELKRFVRYMQEFSKKDDEKQAENCVQLMTIHKSKGLEFPVVFIVGVSNNLLPHHRNENYNEEQRLMYVAITRAEKLLYISSTLFYNGKEAGDSKFIEQCFGA